MPGDVEQELSDAVAQELSDAVARVLASQSRKKLIVAGPGAGKTTLFRKLLDQTDGDASRRLVLTFINNLKDDLDRSLGDAADVFTLHGYCQRLLRRYAGLRNGLTSDFVCYPGLVSLIKKDWQWLENKSDAWKFVEEMRALNCSAVHDAFYTARSNYYDAVDFDDSVHRTYQRLAADTSLVPAYELALIDEFQDFNNMEASVIDLLAERNRIVIAGDDDQALYSQLRGASWDYIRAHYESGHYEIFELPFCMRCPEVIVGAVNDVIEQARKAKNLHGRIDKPYRYYEPVKGDDSRRYPKIELVESSTQRANANYFGRYIEECIQGIPEQDFKLAAEKNEPAVLVIGSNPYRRQVENYLVEKRMITTNATIELSDRQRAFDILVRDGESNLGWRIILAEENENVARDAVRSTAGNGGKLVNAIADSLRLAVLKEAQEWAANRTSKQESDRDVASVSKIKVVSFEGAKGLSAQYVFLIGLHSGELPRNARDVQDIEICRFLVGMTRTKKKCSILVTTRFGEQVKRRSEFLSWIKADRFDEKKINAAYWNK
jgi:ATP-dependent DNA helicase UvrD/PcrA